jgi:hypothetical protein
MPQKYFENFPFRGYTLDANAGIGDYVAVTDIFKRVKFRTDLLGNARLYYPYQIKEGDSPEILAYKYYGSVDYYWIILLVNQIIDPLRDWPKNYQSFHQHILDTYSTVENAQLSIHHYEKILTKTNSFGETSQNITVIDASQYADLTSVVPISYSFSDGSTVTITTTRRAIDCYTYEEEQNDLRRNILLLKSEFVGHVVSELETI